MRKLWLTAVLLLGASSAKAMQLEPQFRLWRSSSVPANSFGWIQLSSEPVIFHAFIASETVNQGGTNFFSMIASSNDTVTIDYSTKVFISLNAASGGVNDAVGFPWDVYFSSHVFYQKQGGASGNILWDYYRTPPNYTTGGDPQSGRVNRP